MAKKLISKVENKVTSSKGSSSKSKSGSSSKSKTNTKSKTNKTIKEVKNQAKKTPSKKTTTPKKTPSKYSASKVAQTAATQLSNSLKDKNGRGMFTNDLDAYVSNQLRNDYADVIGYDNILGKMNAQSDAAWELARAQQIQALNAAESQNYADTKNAVAQMRKSLAGSAASGANQGAANATALQAILGLGQQNAERTTEGMQNYQNAAKEAAAARAENAVNALETAREGMNSMYDQATSAYSADHTYGVQGVAEAYGNVAAGTEAGRSAERVAKTEAAATKAAAKIEADASKKVAKLNTKSNEKIANTTSKSKQIVINKKK